MKWLLFFFIFNGDAVQTPVIVEFDDRKACEFAAEHLPIDMQVQKYYVGCFPKRSFRP